MKIIFDNEEQKKKFIGFLACANNICPFDIGLPAPSIEPFCVMCWEQALEIEVKEKKNEPNN